MTLYELDLLAVRHRQQQEREDRRAALAAWVLANVNRDTKQRSEPFSLDEVTAWLGYARPRPPNISVPAAAPTPEELRQRLGIVHLLHQGLYGDSGQTASEDR